MRTYTLSILMVLLLASGIVAQTDPGHIFINPHIKYSQNDKQVTFAIKANDDLQGLKGIHLDIDFSEPQVFGPDSAGQQGIEAVPGNMFADNDTITFFWDYLWTDSTRLTVDIFVLTDSQTVSGPGDLVLLNMHTDQVFRGFSEITLSNITIRDRFNEDIPFTNAGAEITVCQFVGDVNADDRLNIQDVTYLVDYLFGGGPAPQPLAAGDVNCDGSLNILDLTLMVGYLFNNGSLCGPCVD
ncbi:hypothetical protein GF356_08265 [candidate division GN15 bacterium]|nr:hypothetical protein [candidate division GN15 bacterium]